MQLFGLTNTLLSRDQETFKRHLSIQKYPVIPLATSSGLLGWVRMLKTERLHSLTGAYSCQRRTRYTY
jgi:FKBP12-rapamycin complex-associated protein